MIAKSGSGYVVKSEDGKRVLSKRYKTKAEAKVRLRQIEHFKNKGK